MPHKFQIAKPENFNFGECLWFLDRNFDDCMHKADSSSVTKLLHLQQEPFLLRITEQGSRLQVEVLAGKTSLADEEAMMSYLTEWLDLKRDILPLKELIVCDPQLKSLVEKYWGLRLISIPDLFEALCWSIIGQQINLKFAYKLKRRLVEAVGDSLMHQGATYHAFPTPRQVLKLSVDEMKQMQFSTQKAHYLLAVSKAFIADEMSREKLSQLADTPQIISQLTALKGIGEWTANYVAMKCLRRMDAVTYSDAGLLNGFKKLKNLDAKPERNELQAFFSQFPGWEAYVVFYIWRSLS